jgi:hypothetical protein
MQGLDSIGMVSDAMWSDFDADGLPDLILACEWMPLTFLRNTGKGLERIHPSEEIDRAIGWWNSLGAADFDQDGDMDYVAGNYGLNTYFKCDAGEPVRVYAKDFDQNGTLDPFISCYFPDSSGKRQEYFFHSKDDMQKQLILIRRKYERYADFGRARASDVFTKEEMKGVMVLEATHMASVWLENLGKGQFRMHALPMEAQFAPLYGMQCQDFDGDGRPDILLTGNDYGMETGQGRADALNGLLLLNRGAGRFEPQGLDASGFLVRGDARALATVMVGGRPMVVSTQNRKGLQLYRWASGEGFVLEPQQGEAYAILTLSGGKRQRVEFSSLHTFLSQSSRKIPVTTACEKIDLYNRAGVLTRTVVPGKKY